MARLSTQAWVGELQRQRNLHGMKCGQALVDIIRAYDEWGPATCDVPARLQAAIEAGRALVADSL